MTANQFQRLADETLRTWEWATEQDGLGGIMPTVTK